MSRRKIIRADLAASRPRVYSVRMSKELADRVAAYGEANGLTASEVIRLAADRLTEPLTIAGPIHVTGALRWPEAKPQNAMTIEYSTTGPKP